MINYQARDCDMQTLHNHGHNNYTTDRHLYDIAQSFNGGKFWRIWASDLSKFSLLNFSVSLWNLQSIHHFMWASFVKVFPCQAFAPYSNLYIC